MLFLFYHDQLMSLLCCNLSFFREDVGVIFGGINTDSSIFELTAKSFLKVCEMFCKTKRQDSFSYVLLLTSELFYNLILIVSIIS